MARSSLREWLFGVVLVYLSAVILVTGVDAMHLRPDENLVFDQTRFDLNYIVTYLIEQDSHPLLWKTSFWGWRQLVGDSEFAGRMQAMFASMITLSLVYQIGRRWFGAARYGLFAMALLGVNSFFFIYSLEIRPYGVMMLLATASMWWFQRWVRREQWRAGICYAITVALMLYVHYFLIVLISAQGLYFLLMRPSRRLWRQLPVVGLVTLLIWLPWIPVMLIQIPRVHDAEVTGGNARGLIGMGATTMPTSFKAVMALARLASNGLVLLYVGVLLLSLVYLWRKPNYRLTLMWALGAPTISLLVNLVFAIFLPRYVDYMMIGLALALGAGLATLPKRLRWPVLSAMVIVSLVTQHSQIAADRIPFRDLFQQVSTNAGPDDAIFFDTGGLGDPFVRAQTRRYLDPDLWQRRVEDRETALEHRRIWYVTGSEWLDAGTQERFRQIEQSHPLQQVIGRCDNDWCYLLQLLEAPPNNTPVLFGDSLAFRGLDVDQVSDEEIAVRLWWTTADRLSLDYSIGLLLLDGSGRLVAQSDGPLSDWYSGSPIQTSTMEPGKIYIDARTLTLPPELPPGPFTLTLVVYQSWDSVRLLLPDETDLLNLATVDLENHELVLLGLEDPR